MTVYPPSHCYSVNAEGGLGVEGDPGQVGGVLRPKAGNPPSEHRRLLDPQIFVRASEGRRTAVGGIDPQDRIVADINRRGLLRNNVGSVRTLAPIIGSMAFESALVSPATVAVAVKMTCEPSGSLGVV